MPPKEKLRTAGHVISRIKWDPDLDMSNILFGYMDRIIGPMEKPVANYLGMDSGGEIPEHRILYFRRKPSASLVSTTVGACILWDRAGRVDRIFGSTNNVVSETTVQYVLEAERNMIRIEEEREERRLQKAKIRARRAQQRAQKEIGNTNVQQNEVARRMHWESTSVYEWDGSQWCISSQQDDTKASGVSGINVVTWNVLFDFFGDEEYSALCGRYEALCRCLADSSPDVIVLQEVTPKFLRILCSHTWVRQQFAVSAAPYYETTVSPSGVLVLWRKSRFLHVSLTHCVDIGRYRSAVVTLRYDDILLAVAAVHLPADQMNDAKTQRLSRTTARRRELGCIVGQLERLRKSASVEELGYVPLLVGDFNCEDDELNSFGVVSMSDATRFGDAWTGSRNAWTYDPIENPLAAKNSVLSRGPRRIDRILYSGPIQPFESRRLGKGAAVSDHYGVRCTLYRNEGVNRSFTDSLWSRISPASAHYMLALTLNQPSLEEMKACNDKHSSLPYLHVTLLHGFVEGDHGLFDLVVANIEDTLRHVVKIPEEFLLDCLEVFDHRESSSVVGILDKNSSIAVGVFREQLLAKFPSCGEDSRRYKPHGSATAARELISCWDMSPDNHWKQPLSVCSIDFLKRGPTGRFQVLHTFPLQLPPSQKLSIGSFIRDACALSNDVFNSSIRLIVPRIERAIRTAPRLSAYRTSVRLSGSAFLKTALWKQSDIDIIVLVVSRDGTNKHSIIEIIAASLKLEFPSISVRIRPAGKLGTILTIRSPSIPCVDVAISVCSDDSEPKSPADQFALDALTFGRTVLKNIQTLGGKPCVQAFQGAVRLVKLWAIRRDIYGAATGYLGGGGWALWVACVLLAAPSKIVSAILNEPSTAQAARHMAKVFFAAASCVQPGDTITMRSEDRIVDHASPYRATLRLVPPDSSDFAAHLTKTTTQTLLSEVNRASRLLQREGEEPWKVAFEKRTMDSFLSEFDSIIIVRASYTGNLKPVEVKARGSNIFISTLVELERRLSHIGLTDSLRPMATPVRLKSQTMIEFAFLIGVPSQVVVALENYKELDVISSVHAKLDTAVVLEIHSSVQVREILSATTNRSTE